MNHIKIIATGIIALVIGLTGGYFLFSAKAATTASTPVEQQATTSAENNDASVEEWICSMHPQIRQNEPGLCPICEMDLIPAGANTSNDPLVLEMTEEAVKLAHVETTIIGTTTANGKAKKIQLSGKIQADERHAASLVAHVSGRIERLYVSFTGEQVQKGQKIADIYAPDLIAAQQELLEALKLQALNPNLVVAARNKLRYWKINDATIEALELQGKIQETFSLYAESNGIVMNKRVAVGDYIRQGEALFEVVNLEKLWVLFDAYEEVLPHIKKGAAISFTTPSAPHQTFTSKVSFIDPIINPNTRVAAVRTEINNRKGLLKPEMLVTGTLNANKGPTTELQVPKSAVLWTGKRSVVYVKIPDTEIPSYQYREIELGDALGDTYQVVQGLETGEEVVVQGGFTIDAAAQLNNQSSMMNRDVQLKKDDTGTIPNFQAATPEAFKRQLNTLANAYIQLKDAFVATDAQTASTAAKTVFTKLDAVDMQLVKGDAHTFWMEQQGAMQAHTQKIVDYSDVEEQRKQFGFLSTLLIDTITAFGTLGDALYVQHCPMAFNNTGGDWLALEEQIQNPYFGDKMMKCGLVKKTFQ